MLPRAFIKGYDQRRLRNLLAVLFLALAVPTGVVIWQAYGQLKWEAFFQYRNQAEELTNRIDLALGGSIDTAEARNFTDFSFLNVAGDPNILQRSPLSAFPVTEDVPGAIGYFQVDSDGVFSTPIMPANEIESGKAGIGVDEYAARQALSQEILQILSDNQLVRSREETVGRLVSRNQPAPATVMAPPAGEPEKEGADRDAEEIIVTGARLTSAETAQVPEAAEEELGALYDQQVFDQLNQSMRFDAPAASASEPGFAKKKDLNLDDELLRKSEGLARQLDESDEDRKYSALSSDVRARRVEKAALPAGSPSEAVDNAGTAGGEAVTISAFESEIDPYEFSLLDSGHFVLFRKVWREGERIIQGILIDQDEFQASVIESAFRSTALSGMSNLIVGYEDNVISLINGTAYGSRMPLSAGDLDGSLLYRSSLSAPLQGLELIFSINRLPPGPGATVLAWTTIVIGVVFLGGFFALYRLGLSQIRLARQQQDFVSAVSHELKTPLTSIRMYGEMLKEGWADEAKQKQYYEYIHDESERLTRLISNVLQLAKITRNEPQFELKPLTVAKLMDQIRSKIANQVERAGFKLELNQDEGVGKAQISVDDDCFAQIIINLVDNAIKFSKNAQNKVISIGCSLTKDNQVVFTVRDHGPGIPRDQMKKIFKLFYRTESELTRETVGTGIGLAIVHQLTTAMSGSVDVVNREPGVEFRVSFPVS